MYILHLASIYGKDCILSRWSLSIYPILALRRLEYMETGASQVLHISDL